VPRPFQFAVTAPPIRPDLAAWADELRHVETMGIATVVLADHWTDGYDTEPMVALSMAAALTSSLRLQAGVLGNDYRHPVLTHRMAATLQLLCNGRFVLGLGAGWLATDYETAGLPFDPPDVRVERLEEAVAVIKRLFEPEPLTYRGTHYQIENLDGLPKVEHAPCLFIGGGRPRVLRLAGREADVVGLNASLRNGALGNHAVRDLAADQIAQKLVWIAEGAEQVGRQLEGLDLALNHWLVRVTETEAAAHQFLERIAERLDVPVSILEASPAVLVGTPDQLVSKLRADRDRFGINVVQLDAGFHPSQLDSWSPIIAELAGT
jgi:probable F420-dependent oxidoreductase